MGWLGEFFGAMPAVFRALWEFGEGWYGVAVTAGSVALGVGFAALAAVLRATHGWLSAIFGAMAATVAFFWIFGILPSAWVYFADSERDLLEGTIIPEALPGMENFYQVFRDSVVVGQTTIAVIVFALVAAAIQRRYPRALAEGEDKGPTSGGYR